MPVECVLAYAHSMAVTSLRSQDRPDPQPPFDLDVFEAYRMVLRELVFPSNRR